METATWIAAISTLCTALAAIATAWIAYYQLSKLNETLRMNTLSIGLDLERAITERKQKAEHQASVLREERHKNSPDAYLKILEEELDGYLEDWFNAVDRLAYCIRKDYLPGDEWKSEYQIYIATLVKDHRDFFDGDSSYRNILFLHLEWQENQ